jgi:hypothetical protein
MLYVVCFSVGNQDNLPPVGLTMSGEVVWERKRKSVTLVKLVMAARAQEERWKVDLDPD